MPSAEVGGMESSATLAEEFGLSDKELQSLNAQLNKGCSEVRLLEGRRNIILNFDAAHRLTSIRQTFTDTELTIRIREFRVRIARYLVRIAC